MYVVQLAIGAVILLFAITLFFVRVGVFSLRRFLPVLFVVAVLFPYIRLPGRIPDIRPEFIIVISAYVLLFLNHLAMGHPIRLRHFPVYKWFSLLVFSIMLSMLYASLFKGQSIIGRDYWEIIKLCLYLLIFVFVANENIDPVELKRFYKFVLIILMLSAFFGFLQYINFAGINEVVSPYYAPTQMRGLLVHGRITGTTPNPNEFGALMVLAASLALSGAMFFREWKLQLLCWVALLVYGTALILTLSRTSLVSLFVAGATVIFFFFKRKDIKYKSRRLWIFLLLGCIIAILILQVMPEKGFSRYAELRTFSEASSFQVRVEIWKKHYAIWTESPWLGWGPGKADMSTIVDNEWLFLLRRYGVIGLSVFLGFCGCLFSGLSRIRKNSSDPSIVALTVSLQSTFLGFIIYMALANVYHSLQLMPILMLLLGLAYTQWRPEKTSCREC
jgi:O-antigen ligase